MAEQNGPSGVLPHTPVVTPEGLAAQREQERREGQEIARRVTDIAPSRSVWKYVLDEPEVSLGMPRGATILHVASQNNKPTMWVLVDPTEPVEVRYFTVVGTGHTTDVEASQYLGTCHNVVNLGLVFHVFEATANPGSAVPRG